MKKLLILLTLVPLVACKKNDPETEVGKYDEGMLVLNEGLYQSNNASVTYYHYEGKKSYQQIFSINNGRGLGDVANDWEYYELSGSAYIIIAVDLSSQLEIVNAKDFTSVAQIPLFNGTVAREPREVKVVGSMAYSCNYDGTVSVIDLNSHTVTNTVDVGQNPDGMAIVGDYLYTANSGGLNWPVYDSTVSVIDLNSNQVVATFESRVNCSSMIADGEGDIYLISNGNYSTIAPAMLRIDTQTNQVTDEYAVSISSWDLSNDYLYYYDSDLQGVYRFNTLTETFENQKIIDCSSYQTMYGVHVSGELICTVDANGYTNSSTVRIYNAEGALQAEFTAGFLATDIIF